MAYLYYSNFCRVFLKPQSCNKIIGLRASTSSEVSTALRPFYFAVHPDLFGQHPTERAVNEASLQQLSSYIETIIQSKTPSPTKLRFFLRIDRASKGVEYVSIFLKYIPLPINNLSLRLAPLKEININLKTRDLRQVVTNVLQSCSISTAGAEKIAKEAPKDANRFQEDFKRYENARGFDLRQEVVRERSTFSLKSFLKKTSSEARKRQDAAAPVREEALRQSESLAKFLQLKEVSWDCGWSNAHFIGCIQSLHTLAQDHPSLVEILKGRKLIFGNETGVSLDGLVMLNSGEPRHNWLELTKHIPKADAALKRIPSLEKAVSGLLNDIKVVRRKFQQKVLASNYEAQLRRLATNLNDYKGTRNYPAEWPESLQQYSLVIETAAGPLMLSPTGQFIVPSSCPAFLLVSFLSSHLSKAREVLEKYQREKEVEKILSRQVIVHLGLAALRKDDAVTPERMIKCCERLLDSIPIIGDSLKGAELRVTHYYSVLADGEVCVPWDWNE